MLNNDIVKWVKPPPSGDASQYSWMRIWECRRAAWKHELRGLEERGPNPPNGWERRLRGSDHTPVQTCQIPQEEWHQLDQDYLRMQYYMLFVVKLFLKSETPPDREAVAGWHGVRSLACQALTVLCIWSANTHPAFHTWRSWPHIRFSGSVAFLPFVAPPGTQSNTRC